MDLEDILLCGLGGKENLIYREKSQGWTRSRKEKVSKSKQRMPYAHLGKAR